MKIVDLAGTYVLQTKRQAATQPTYDLISGQPTDASGQQPLKRSISRQSLTARPGSQLGNHEEDLRAQLNSLRYELENLQQERGLLTLQHEKEIRELQVKAEADYKKAQAAEGVALKASKKYEALQKEVRDAQDQNINEKASLERKLRDAQDRNQSLQEEVEDAQERLADQDRHYKYQINEIEAKCTTLEDTVASFKQDLQALNADLDATNAALTKQNAENENHEAEIVRLKARAGDSETLAVIQRELSDQVTHIRRLESANREQAAELRKLRDAHKSVQVVEEQKRSLETELQVMNDVQRQMGELQIQKELLEDERRTWTSLLEREGQDIQFQSPEAVVKAFVQEQIEHASAVDRLGKAQAEVSEKDEVIRALEKSRGKLKEEIAKLEASSAAAGSAPPLPDNKAVKRLERQRTLAVKEVEYLRAQLKTFDTEETMMFPEDNNFDAVKVQQIQQLEFLVDEYRKEIHALHEDLSKYENTSSISAQAPATRGTKRSLEEEEQDESSQYGQILRKNKNLQASLTELQEKNQLLQTELTAAKKQLSSLKTRSRTRILELRSNPTDDYFNLQRSTLAALKAENAALLSQVRSEPLSTKVVPISTLESKEFEMKELERTIADKEKQLDRNRKIWMNKAMEFREAVGSVLGWKVDFLPNGKARLTSMFHVRQLGSDSDSDPDDWSIIFDGEQGTMKFAAGPNSPFALECKDLVRFWVQERGEVPCFLAAVALECYERTTRAARV
ncbi:putative m protein repeat protein [Phaeomoniella chlamydospora]|uniref:Spindle assembly checkpoint component MAD1 n=1 Tax=Phaeomoniella chlamydospora TaxID=158046 RepID=A0A0G2E6U6_PHACM|nr:putative m protein repeat protein [Phaeomoniella chlamydospora]